MIQSSSKNKWVRSILHPSPNAIAIILGPLSSHPYDTMMERIGHMYYYNHDTRRPQERGCTVILASSPPLQFILNRNLQSIAQEVLLETSMALSSLLLELQHTAQQFQQPPPPPQPKIPIIIHSFSNGGAFLQEAIELELLRGINMNTTIQSKNGMTIPFQANTYHNTTTKVNYERIRSGMKIGYQFFDSCPCYIRTIWDTKHWTDSFPHGRLPQWFRYVYTMGSALALSTWCLFTLSWHRPHQFWNRMVHSTICTRHQIYMYTTTDLLTDAAAVDRYVDIRRQQYNTKCTVYRYNDSNHCRFYIDHPDEYQTAIDDALESVCRDE